MFNGISMRAKPPAERSRWLSIREGRRDGGVPPRRGGAARYCLGGSGFGVATFSGVFAGSFAGSFVRGLAGALGGTSFTS